MIWNRGWEFRLEDEPGKSGWQTVHLPHTFSLPYFMSDSFYTGLGSYRKKLVMPEEWQGKKVFLDCGASFQVAEVKVNGKTAGRHEGGYTAFRSDLTPFLKPGENGWRYGWITAGAPALRRGRGSILFRRTVPERASARVFSRVSARARSMGSDAGGDGGPREGPDFDGSEE